jgi:hypothetical protein
MKMIVFHVQTFIQCNKTEQNRLRQLCLWLHNILRLECVPYVPQRIKPDELRSNVKMLVHLYTYTRLATQIHLIGNWHSMLAGGH